MKNGAPAGGDRSAIFMSVVRSLKANRCTVDRIEHYLAKHPHGIAGRYISEGRLRAEIERAYNKPDKEQPEQPKSETPNGHTSDGSPIVTDDSLALAFTERHPTLRYVAMWGKWLRYDGTRWAFDKRCNFRPRTRNLP